MVVRREEVQYREGKKGGREEKEKKNDHLKRFISF